MGIATEDRTLYGAVEQAGLLPGEQQRLLDQINADGNQTVYWSDPALKRIVRMRFLTDRGFPLLDHSYTYGELRDGSLVRVQLPFFQLTKRSWKTELVNWARKDRVYAKALGVFDDGVVSILWG